MDDEPDTNEFYVKLRRFVPTILADLQAHRSKPVPSVASPTATLEYHVFADAMYWTDELAQLPHEIDDAFRLVLNHRTSLLEGGVGRFPEVWQTASECFPQWVGFLPERCAANGAVADRLRRIRRVSHRQIERFEFRFYES